VRDEIRKELVTLCEKRKAPPADGAERIQEKTRPKEKIVVLVCAGSPHTGAFNEIDEFEESCMKHKAVPETQSMTVFERYLTLWVGLCIVGGIVLGSVAPGWPALSTDCPFMSTVRRWCRSQLRSVSFS
jgi:hypothetical protein